MRCPAVARLLVAVWLPMLSAWVPGCAQSAPALGKPAAQPVKLRDDPAYEPLQRGDLVVWLLFHQPPKPAVKTVALPAASPEQTAGSFGQTSSSIGTNAGAAGQTAGGFGRVSSSTGSTAGSTGQTAGSFGVATSQLAQSIANRRRPEEQSTALTRYALSRDHLKYHGPFQRLRFVDVGDGELADRLAAADGTDAAPDVLLGHPLPVEWTAEDSRLARRYGAAMLGDGVSAVQREHGGWSREHPQAAILLKARHPAQAGAYVTWLRDGMPDSHECIGCWVRTQETDAPVEAAERALRSLLAVQSPGDDADPEMAKFDARSTALAALKVSEPLNLSLDVAVSEVRMNEHLALVQMRGVVANASAFGVLHALAVLRPDAGGRWRVLHLTPNLDVEEIIGADQMLAPYATAKPAGFAATAAATERLGVSLAAPLDGDARGPLPELWWDNAGGATMQVVEWQVCERVCSDSNLYLVPDTDVRLHTRVVAQFASAPGQYRWRVWSLGVGQDLVLSPWRTLHILRQ